MPVAPMPAGAADTVRATPPTPSPTFTLPLSGKLVGDLQSSFHIRLVSRPLGQTLQEGTVLC